MINYTARLDKAIRIAAWSHHHNKNKENRYRKGTDIPYIIHPFGVMLIASNATDDEDVLIGCLLHDVLEDVHSKTYSETQLLEDFGAKVLAIVKDVSKDDTIKGWKKRSDGYLEHLEHKACDQAVIVSAADKIHNLLSILNDFETHGDAIWQRFTTKSAKDQLWWYESILAVIKKRKVPALLIEQLSKAINDLKNKI